MLHGDVDARMAGQQIKHMVEEADSGGDVGHAGAIEIDGHLDVGLFRLALDGGAAHEMLPLGTKPLAENAVLLTGHSRLRHCGMPFWRSKLSLW